MVLRLNLVPFLWPLIRVILGAYLASSVLRPADICGAQQSPPPCGVEPWGISANLPSPISLCPAGPPRVGTLRALGTLGPAPSAPPLPGPSTGAETEGVLLIIT